MATPSQAEASIFDTWNDSTRGRRGVGDNIRGAPAAAAPCPDQPGDVRYRHFSWPRAMSASWDAHTADARRPFRF